MVFFNGQLIKRPNSKILYHNMLYKKENRTDNASNLMNIKIRNILCILCIIPSQYAMLCVCIKLVLPFSNFKNSDRLREDTVCLLKYYQGQQLIPEFKFFH